MTFPKARPRRLRRTESIRRLVRETHLSPNQFVLPLFVTEGKKTAIASMPGIFRWTLKDVAREARDAYRLGIPAVLLFGIPNHKDTEASGAYDADGIVQRAVREIKNKVPEMVVMTDVCLCEYMSHGHCGIVKGKGIDNDASLDLLSQTAVSHAEAGADWVAPSDMMDGRVRAIRKALDASGFSETSLMSYAVKYASAFYGPFREAAGSAPSFGDRRSYQMDAANVREALREAELDIAEGADVIMVKPALAYLDVIRAVREKVNVPVAAYNVSGEYAMIKAAAQKGWLDEKAVMLETLLAMRRAGADKIITYFAKDAAKTLSD